MMVYGDPQFNERASVFVRQLKRRWDSAPADGLEALRARLIQAGQLEQAAQDQWPAPHPDEQRLLGDFQAVTDHAAAAFEAKWVNGGIRKAEALPHAQAALRALGQAADRLRALGLGDAQLTVKVPEGFEFYALYPEQYCMAAMRWASLHEQIAPRQAVVVGIRSIGTTLSAAVATTLRRAGWEVERLTVRPGGHPFARRLRFSDHALNPCACALVVDEGPGLSGSSMAAVADALVAAGVEQRRISFFPGHAGNPGAAATPEVCRWWTAVPRFVTPLSELRWNALAIEQALAVKSAELCGTDEPFGTIDNLSGGCWREVVYSDPGKWPAAVTPFERLKFRCGARTGQRVLWKFAGLGAVLEGGRTAVERATAQLSERAKAGWVPPPLGTAHGFIAMPWIEGTPLSIADAAQPGVIQRIGQYLVRSAGPPLSEKEAATAHSRLAEMLYWNTREALGEAAAQRTRRWVKAAHGLANGPSYGDGRLAPHEWVRDRAGRIFKTDSFGHDADHTLVGKQPLLWDVAGAMVEWELESSAAEALLRAVEAGGIPMSRPALAFHCLAYCAFRLGQMAPCAGSGAVDKLEQQRLRHAEERYRRRLAMVNLMV